MSSSLTTAPKRRNRAKRPTWSFSGLNVDQWQVDSERIRWAQTDARFRDVLTVLINERTKHHCLNQAGGHSEGYHLGLVRGFEAAIAVVQSLAHGAPPPPSPIGDPDYIDPDQAPR